MAWLSSWSYRKTVSITGQTGAGTNYQVDFSIGDGSGGDFHLESHCTSFPNDIQVTDNDQTTSLDYWVEDLTVDPITMWVEVADDLGSNVDICIYYSKSGASTESNIDNTFPFGDVFAGASLDGNKWDTSGAPTVSGGAVHLANDDWITGKTAFGNGYCFASRAKANEQDSVFIAACETHNVWNDDNIMIGNTDLYSDDFDRVFLDFWKGASQNTVHIDNWNDFRNTYYHYNIKKISNSKVILEQELNSHTYTDTSYISTQNLKWASRVWDSSQESTLDVDWALVRKCVSPEPAFSSAGNEESETGVGHPTMSRWHGIPGMNYTGRAGVGW